MKSLTSKSILLALLATAILVVCSNAWLAFHSVQAVSRSQQWVDRTWRVIDTLEQVTDSLDQAETSTRGFLLSGDPVYLAPYARAKAALPGELNAIAGLLATDDPQETPTLRELRAVVERRMLLLEQSIEERRAEQANRTHLQVLGETERTEMTHARSIVSRMQQSEHHLLEQRAVASRRDARRARITVIFASTVDLLLLLLTFRYIAVERRLRRHADQTSERLEKLQSISDVALTHLTSTDLTAELLTRLIKVVSADSAMLCILRDGAIRVEAATGIEIDPGTVIPRIEGGVFDRALKHNEVSMREDTPSAPLSPEILSRQTRSLLAAPLSISGSVTGLLVAGRQTIHAFNSHDAEMLSVAASRISVALDRAKAYDAQKQARNDAEAKAEEVRLLNEELEQRVAQRTAELEDTNRELEAFSYSVSHDLRAPLRTVDGFSLALEEDYGKIIDPTGQDYLRRIRDGVQRMGHLIDSLLQLSRITRAELTRESVDLSTLATAVAEELRAHNPGRSMVFKIQPGMETTGDSRLLRSAFENLLGNSVKFTARVPEAHVEVGCSKNVYFIRDNGAGFDMRYANKLFTAFHRLHGDREFRGSGIGLATVARVIHRHQGKIWAEGEVGRGATFWFTLG